MLTEICEYLKNWFDRDLPKYHGEFNISNNTITKVDTETLEFLAGQYVRITGSILNNGVHKYPFSDLQDETFSGSVWSMGVPKAVEQIAEDIAQWQERYGGADSSAVSPYQSESFGGYSYSKGSANSSTSDSVTWQNVFGARLRPYKKLP